MSKSATEQFQIKKKRKHPLSVSNTVPLNKSYKRHIHSVLSSSLSSSTATAAAVAAADFLIKDSYTELQIDTKESTKFNSLLQIKSLAGAGVGAVAVAAATAAAAHDNLSEAKKCIITSTPIAPTTTTATTIITQQKPIVAVKNCLRDQSQVLILNTPVNMPLSHEFYVKGAIATKRGLKALKANTASGSTSLGSHEEAKRPRRSNENLKLRSSCFVTQQKTANKLQLSYMLGESLARYGHLQEAFDIYALIASEQPEGFIPLEKLNVLATALLEHIRILSSCSKKSADIMDADSVKALNSEQQKLVTPLRSKYASSTASRALHWPATGSGLNMQTSKLKDLDASFLASAVGGNMDLHSPTRELAGVNNSTLPDDYDPLMCPLCRDVLRCPVTTNCGHTFCRQCCETITMCNICHIKFPRWQKDDSCPNGNNNNNYNNFNLSNNNKLQNFSTTIATLSTATTTTTSMDLTTSHSNLPPYSHHQQSAYSSISPFTTSSSSYTSSTSPSTSMSSIPSSSSSSSLTLSLASSSSSTSLATINELPRLQIITTLLPPSPTTVTTTTIACTTDTATTTMASTSAISGGVALRSSSSNDNMKFMPDVLVRRLVDKWWGDDLLVKKNNETATSYMHLNLLDDALKFCNASLEKCK